MRCQGITGAGERCKLDATHGSYCWSHAPETAAERRRRGQRGGKAGGNGRGGPGEVSEIRALLKELTADVLGYKVETGTAAVVTQLVNARIRLVEVERRLREQDEVLERIEALEEGTRTRERRSSWGA